MTNRFQLMLLCSLIVLPFSSYILEGMAFGEDQSEGAISRISSDLKFLSSDELRGRNTGSEGIRKAGKLIAERFAELGLKTDLYEGQPFQPFSIPGPAAMEKGEANRLTFNIERDGEKEQISLVAGSDFNALSLGNSGEFAGEVVFAGYGISASDLDYDDYAGVDTRGKVVIVIRKEPQQNDPNSKFNGTSSSEYAYFSTKELNAALKRVGALIMVNDNQTAANEDILLGTPDGGRSMGGQVPTIFATRAAIDPIIKAGTGKSLAELEAAIDSDTKPRSQVLKGITSQGATKIAPSKINAQNVVGLLEGKGNLADQFVVVGAHYDHVGMGGPGSLAPGTIAVHNGADDNGSGTTTLLEVARRIAADKSENRRSVVFIAFTGEEKGLLGSKHYVKEPRFPLEDTIAMVNMDMVGRLTENVLTVYGTGTAKGFDALLDKTNKGFDLDKREAGFGPSDHSSFYEVGIPVFHFFTGLHNDYHRPSDDFETVNLEGMGRIASMVTDVVTDLATRPKRPEPLENRSFANVGRRRPPAPSRAIIGINLDLDSQAPSVDEVTEGGPADTAGLKSGDQILSIAGEKTTTLADLRAVMSKRTPGETTVVEIRRGDETLKLEITLGSR